MGRSVSLPTGYRLARFESLDSTSEEARRLAEKGADDGTVVWARRQTAGRGRQGRTWQSPEGNLYCSILVRPDMSAGDAAQFSFVTALALGGALGGFLPERIELRYKWPNDLLLDGRKVAGILLESSGGTAGTLDWLVIGAGLNVAECPPVTGGYPATSMRQAGARNIELEALLERFLAGFAGWRKRWRNEGLAVVREAWLERAARLGEEITVRLPGVELKGRFEGLDESGALLLDMADGSRRLVSAGDVFF
jgi:BirA family biotin operon repressor/biotin-[acetyl-CoA-carboxylase] ligase